MTKLIPDLNVTLVTTQKAWDRMVDGEDNDYKEMSEATSRFKNTGFSTFAKSNSDGDVEYCVGIREDLLDGFADNDRMSDLAASLGCVARLYWFNLIADADIVTPSSKNDCIAIYQGVIDSLSDELFGAIGQAQKDAVEKRKEERRAQRKAKKAEAGKKDAEAKAVDGRDPANRLGAKVEERLAEEGVSAEVEIASLGEGIDAVTVSPQAEDADGDAPKIDFNL